jgi:hypothetical protein
MEGGAISYLKSRVVIHAGFAKCGSASIRTALFNNFRKLQKDSVFVFDKDLKIARTATDLIGTPIWSIEQARQKSENLAPRIGKEIAAVANRKRDHVAVLSAENLANPGMAELFAGLDTILDTHVVFYLRPQLQWIPSAWKQWGLKTGVPLSDFVSQCIDSRTPTFRQGIGTWEAVLPEAKIHVRFLIPELLTGGNPAQDFFKMLGLSEEEYQFESDARNPSLDVSVLHALSKNPHLFSDVHDNSLTLALTRTLSKKFRSTNIEMLSPEQERKIEECFRDENLCLLRGYFGETDAERIYQAYFMPRKADARYSDMTDLELIYRCLGIILESIAFTGDQVDRGKKKNQTPGPLAVEEE